ncbi:hypothetical protein ACHWQZ_G016341 [Mnemiopsis leidyi]
MPGSDIVTEDDVIRKRLLMDGEGSGEEKRVVNLLKTFVKWVKEPNSDEATFQKCEMTVDKLHVVKQMNELEAKNYAKLHSEIELEIEAGKERIEKYQQQLSKAKQIKSHKLQYDAIAQLIKQYPSKDETTAAISRTEKEIEELKKKKIFFEEEVQKRKRQFEVLVYSIQQLQCELSQDPVQEMEVDS